MEIKTLDIDSLLMLSKFSESSPITSVWRRSKMLLGKHNPSLLKVVPEQREVSQSCWHLVSRIPVNPPGSVPEGLLPLGFAPARSRKSSCRLLVHRLNSPLTTPCLSRLSLDPLQCGQSCLPPFLNEIVPFLQPRHTFTIIMVILCFVSWSCSL